jgi:hypothetical protein
MNKRMLIGLGSAALAVSLIAAPVLSQGTPLTGAIFTTLRDGTRVNANLYEAKQDVYLDGGPGPNAPQEAAGLPDGDYYFQVTDPSGKVLLSTDPVRNRQFSVFNGKIVGLSGFGDHATGLDQDHGATTVQLLPFLDTPNKGGVYKAWVTRVVDFVGSPAVVDNGYSAGYFHGFIPAFSKVDNFKVRKRGTSQLPCLTIVVFKDRNGNGLLEPATGDFDIGNVEFTVKDPSGATINGALFTGYNGAGYTLCNLIAGTYKVSVVPPNGLFGYAHWYITGANIDGVSIPYTDPPGASVTMGKTNRTLYVGVFYSAY